MHEPVETGNRTCHLPISIDGNAACRSALQLLPQITMLSLSFPGPTQCGKRFFLRGPGGILGSLGIVLG